MRVVVVLERQRQVPSSSKGAAMFRRIACAVVIVLPVLGCHEEPAVPPTPPAPPVTPPPSPTAMGVPTNAIGAVDPGLRLSAQTPA